MAVGARERLGATFAVSVTGIAGPDGGTESKPVGLTYLGLAGPDGIEVRRFAWTGDRAANKRLSAAAALELLIAATEALAATPASAGVR
jgi:nicotinamide-nucleotide amidase